MFQTCLISLTNILVLSTWVTAPFSFMLSLVSPSEEHLESGVWADISSQKSKIWIFSSFSLTQRDYCELKLTSFQLYDCGDMVKGGVQLSKRMMEFVLIVSDVLVVIILLVKIFNINDWLSTESISYSQDHLSSGSSLWSSPIINTSN